MNCQEFWNGEPHGLEHLKECRGCAVRFERQQRLAAGLNTLGGELRWLEAPARVERKLVAAFRAQSELGGGMPQQEWWAVATWAAGLAATMALAVFLVAGHQPQRTEQRIGKSLTQLAAVERQADNANWYGDDFIALPNAEGIAPNEAVNLVRVEVPRSSMIALGFAVTAERASEPVEADVMLGADGVARAVRFVEP